MIAKTYDIINAGRFMANGRIVSNSGRNIQLQNLPQNHIDTLDEARELLKRGEFDMLEMLYDSVPDVLSQLVRTMLIPKSGCEFIICDFSAIEARVLSWLANEEWRLDAFRNGEDIYCASASAMFRKPVVKGGVNGELRAKGKVAELACGYQGASAALIAMGALEMGLSEAELPELIRQWRNANPNIVQFWWNTEKAALKALSDAENCTVGKVSFRYQPGILWMILPSGRKLAYWKPEKTTNKYGGGSLSYLDEANKRQETYAGKLVENCTQSIARDLLAEAMLRIERAGLQIVAHVHDEVIIEAPIGTVSVNKVCGLMNIVPDWAYGLPLASAGYKGNYYFKQ